MLYRHPLFDKPLPEDWRLMNVDDIKADETHSCVAGPFGSNISSKFFVSKGVPVIRGSNLRDDLTQFVPEGFVFVSEEQAKKYKAQHVKAGDLVFTCWGTIGQVGLIPKNGPYKEYIISNKQLKLRPNLKLTDEKFLFYYFASPLMVEFIKNRAIGSAVPGINLGILKSLPIALPPLPTQERIASILSTYDDLIENNNRRIQILEEMAQAIYREWFVHFRYPGHEGVRMVESEMGDVPVGWESATIRDVAAYINRGVSPKYEENSEDWVINQKCIRDNQLDLGSARRHATKVPEFKMVHFGDVLINSTGAGTLGRVAQVYQDLQHFTVDSHVTIARPNQRVTIDYFGFCLLSLQEFFDRMGTGATNQTELGRGTVANADFILPPLSLQQQFSQMVEPIRRSIINLQKRNDNLRKQRDLLLPRLVSGELDVSDLALSIAEVE